MVNNSNQWRSIMIMQMRNETGLTRQVKFGFSWTAFFFGGLPFFFRGLSTTGIIWIILSILTVGLSNIYLMFAINKMTAHKYLEKGYKPVGSGWDIAGSKWGVVVQ